MVVILPRNRDQTEAGWALNHKAPSSSQLPPVNSLYLKVSPCLKPHHQLGYVFKRTSPPGTLHNQPRTFYTCPCQFMVTSQCKHSLYSVYLEKSSEPYSSTEVQSWETQGSLLSGCPYNSKCVQYPNASILVPKGKNRGSMWKTEPTHEQNPAVQTQIL